MAGKRNFRCGDSRLERPPIHLVVSAETHTPLQKTAPRRIFYPNHRKFQFAVDCVAVEAVICELVSAASLGDIREKYREFCEFWPIEAIFTAN